MLCFQCKFIWKSILRILEDISTLRLNFVLFLFSSLFYRNRPFQQAIARVSVMSRSILFEAINFVIFGKIPIFGPDYIPKMNQLWKTEIYKFESKPPWNYSTRWEASLCQCSHFVEGCSLTLNWCGGQFTNNRQASPCENEKLHYSNGSRSKTSDQ